MGRSLGAVHADTVLDVLAGGGLANSGLAASWRRSGHLHALDPTNRAPSRRLTEVELAAAQERLGQLLRLAQSAVDRLFQAVGGVGCSVLLADGGGIVLDRRGVVADDATFEASGLWTGAVWSEKFEGTNGIGTCIVEKRPLIIDRGQHFFTRNSSLFCATAPIFDEDGEFAAALDVSSCRSDLTAAPPDGVRGRGAEAHFEQPGGKRGLNVIRRPEVLAQRASKDGGPEIAPHPSRLWLCPRTSG
jgi:transcriptional regulator of acetoin/glycerol metabolism